MTLLTLHPSQKNVQRREIVNLALATLRSYLSSIIPFTCTALPQVKIPALTLTHLAGRMWPPIEGRQLVLCLCVTQVNNDYIITKRPFGDGFWSAATAAQLSWK